MGVGCVFEAEGFSVGGGACGEFLEETSCGGQVADSTGLEGVFHFGEGSDQGDGDVVGPGGCGQFDGQGCQDLFGGFDVAGDGEFADVFEVQKNVCALGVVADGHQGWVGGGKLFFWFLLLG